MKRVLFLIFLFIFSFNHSKANNGNLTSKLDTFKVSDEISFECKTFNSKVFWKQKFDKKTIFIKSNFWGYTDFGYSKFEKELDFGWCTIDSTVSFNEVEFGHKASFRRLKPKHNSKLTFFNCTPPDTFDFFDIKYLPFDIDLTEINTEKLTDKKCHIFLHKSDVSKFILNYKYFKLLFVNPNNGYKLNQDEIETNYESLLKNFKDRGQLESYQLLDIEYKQFKYPHSAWLQKNWWNFGYNKEYIFYWVIIFLTIFTIINFFIYPKLNAKVYKIDNVEVYPYNSFGLRFWNAFVYTSIIFFLFSLKIENFKFRKWFLCLLVLLIYSFGIICLAYMANFVIQK